MEQNKPESTFTLSFLDQSHGEQLDLHYPTPTVGDPCPRCGKAILAYNGLLQVTCPDCGFQAESGAFT